MVNYTEAILLKYTQSGNYISIHSKNNLVPRFNNTDHCNDIDINILIKSIFEIKFTL